MIARPVSLPPAWTIRRAEWPPSSPSASSAVGLGVEADAALAQLLDRGRRLAGEDLDRARAAQARARRRACRRRGARASRRGERGGEPALGPEARALGERLARDQDDRRSRGRRLERDVQPGGAAADDERRRSSCSARLRRRSRGGLRVPRRGWRSTSPTRPRIEHDTGAHPENARRLVAIEAALERERLARPRAGRGAGGDPRAARARPRRRALDAIEAFCADGGGMIDLDTVASAAAPSRRRCTRPAAPRRRPSGCSPATRATAFCGLRPPGHHAERDRAMGFCLFNNVAVAAAHAIAACGAERVLVLDWDVHHGNGTEAIFAVFGRGALREHPPVAALSRHRGGRVRRARERGRATRSTCRCRPGAGQRGVPRPRRARRGADRPRLRARPDRDLGRLRRPPRRPARLLHGRDRGLRRDDRGAARRSAPSSARRCWSASRAATRRRRWPTRWSRRSARSATARRRGPRRARRPSRTSPGCASAGPL